MASEVWYRNYEAFRLQVDDLKTKFAARCVELKVDSSKVLKEFSREILIRAVHESNWQEGIELAEGKTQELALAAFDDMEEIEGPHLDMNKILRLQRDSILGLKKKGASVEEIAAYNLALAYKSITWIGSDLAGRQALSLVKTLLDIEPMFNQFKDKIPEDLRSRLTDSMQTIHTLKGTAYHDATLPGSAALQEQTFDELKREAVYYPTTSPIPAQIKPLSELLKEPVVFPMTAAPTSQAQLIDELLKLDLHHLTSPMKTAYIHFLHKLVLMGIAPLTKCGTFRSISVHVGNPAIYFPVPSVVPSMMKEFSQKFPAILPPVVKYDPVLVAAKVSHGFVAIHPYADGNGRVSRLLMNLVLWGHFPPVYLKANKKGRQRYSQALRRADRGNIKPLATLIAMSLVEIYQKLLKSLNT
jgi:fido (protein-threonine AMPylation protein)